MEEEVNYRPIFFSLHYSFQVIGLLHFKALKNFHFLKNIICIVSITFSGQHLISRFKIILDSICGIFRDKEIFGGFAHVGLVEDGHITVGVSLDHLIYMDKMF